MIETLADQALRRPEAGHLGPAQEGAALPAAELRAELHPVDLRQPGGLRGQDAGDRRRRPLLQPRGHPDRAEDGRRQRLRPGAGRPAAASSRPPPPATSSASTAPSAASSSRPATTPAARPRTSASSTTSATAARRPSASPRRSTPARKEIDEYRILDAPDLDLDTARHPDARRDDRRGDRPGRRLRRADGDALRLPRHPRDVRRRLPHGLRRDARRHRPLRHRDPREPPRRARRAPSATARRCPTSAATTPTRTSSTPRRSTTR